MTGMRTSCYPAFLGIRTIPIPSDLVDTLKQIRATIGEMCLAAWGFPDFAGARFLSAFAGGEVSLCSVSRHPKIALKSYFSGEPRH
jgi:hypothetical protein